MQRADPLAWTSAALLFGAILLAWFVLHDFSVQVKILLSIAYGALLSAAGFWMWQHGQRRARLIEDIPTSKIVTAPQGYAELLGRAVQMPDTPLLTGLSGTPCLWYRWEVAQRGDATHSRDLVTGLFASLVYWPESSELSQHSFGIEDGTGIAVIFPHQAEIIVAHRQVWYEGDRRYIEERIMPGDDLYVLGDFATHNPGHAAFDMLDEVASQISVWRADHPSLLWRFDTNLNGVLDADEWEAMHRAAMRVTQKRAAEIRSLPQLHRLSAPGLGRHFLLSTRAPAHLAGHYRFWRSVGLTFFLGGGAVSVWLMGWSWLR